MVHLGNLTVIDQNEPLLMELDAQDLVYLLELPEAERLGHIIGLNRSPRYHNRLNAFALLERLMEAAGDPKGATRVPVNGIEAASGPCGGDQG